MYTVHPLFVLEKLWVWS